MFATKRELYHVSWDEIRWMGGGSIWGWRVWPARDAAMGLLAELGWKWSMTYGDGVARMTRTFDGDELAVFVGRDGRVTRPQTIASLRAQAEMALNGVKIRG